MYSDMLSRLACSAGKVRQVVLNCFKLRSIPNRFKKTNAIETAKFVKEFELLVSTESFKKNLTEIQHHAKNGTWFKNQYEFDLLLEEEKTIKKKITDFVFHTYYDEYFTASQLLERYSQQAQAHQA